MVDDACTLLSTLRPCAGCSVTSTARLSPLMVLSGLAGVALFYAAARLSSSFTFRLSCGTLLFTAGSLLFLTVLLLRRAPPPPRHPNARVAEQGRTHGQGGPDALLL